MRTRGRIRIDYGKDLAVIRSSGQWFFFALVMVFLISLPYILHWTGNRGWLTFLNITAVTIIAVLGLNITTGMAGQVSLGHSAFIMMGAYFTAILSMNNIPFWLALPVASLIAAVIGLVVGAPSLRLKGFYLAMATLAFFVVAQYIVRNLGITGSFHGLMGIPAPTIGGFTINDDTEWYYLNLALTLLFIFFSVNLARSRLGRAFLAVRDNDITAASMGINVYATKLQAFFIGSFFAGVAGGLWSTYLTVVRADQFTLWDSIWYLGMIVIGGGGSTAGAVMGVIFLKLLSQILHSISMASWAPHLASNVWVFATSAIYGAIIIVFVLFQPYGLIQLWRKIKINYKRWPFGY